MRWKTEIAPKAGDTQVNSYFAVIPKQLSDGYTVWLEWYNVKEEWIETYGDYHGPYWKEVESWHDKK